MTAALLRRPALFAAACAGMFLATSAAHAQAAPNPDPYEGFNRKSYNLSQSVDRKALRPAAKAWERIVPKIFRAGLRNAYSNLGEPVVFFNDLMQLRPSDASVTLRRFIVNSTFGVAGLADIAKTDGLPHHDNGFGVTLGRAGVGPGPYVYLPVLGPSTQRDLFGSGVDTLLNPLTWIGYGARTPVGIAQTISGGLNARADADSDLETIKATATDEYATLRSLYLQNRQALVSGKAVDVNALPDFDDPGAGPTSRSPTGKPPEKSQGPSVPSGDASALPSPAPSSDSNPPAPPPNPKDD